MNSKSKKLEAFARLLDIMDLLRNECPWDKKQTIESLRHLTIEETYELSESILNGDKNDIKQELGDILLHVVFYSKIASEENAFDIKDVIEKICEKLIYRHPHIFGKVKVADESDVKKNWEVLKLKEGKNNLLSGVPNSLPSLIKAQRIQEKAAGVGFDWNTAEEVWSKVQEELVELKVEIQNGSQSKIEEEFGDFLFSMVNYARFLNIEPDTALEKANKKFTKRLLFIENVTKEKGKSINELNHSELDSLWLEAKNYDSLEDKSS